MGSAAGQRNGEGAISKTFHRGEAVRPPVSLFGARWERARHVWGVGDLLGHAPSHPWGLEWIILRGLEVLNLLRGSWL